METTTSRRNFWSQAIAVALVIVGLLILFIQAQTKPLDSSNLKIPVANSRSYAAAAQLLIDRTQEDKVTQTFFEAQTIMLRDKAEQVLKELESAKVESGLEMKLWQARQFARELKTHLDELQSSFTNTPHLKELKHQLEELTPRLKELESTLAE